MPIIRGDIVDTPSGQRAQALFEGFSETASVEGELPRISGGGKIYFFERLVLDSKTGRSEIFEDTVFFEKWSAVKSTADKITEAEERACSGLASILKQCHALSIKNLNRPSPKTSVLLSQTIAKAKQEMTKFQEGIGENFSIKNFDLPPPPPPLQRLALAKFGRPDLTGSGS